MRGMIMTPGLEDVERTGLSGSEVTIATAFYTAWPLDELTITAQTLNLYVRLSLTDLRDWVAGAVDPLALSRFVVRHEGAGITVNLRRSDDAHAKLYIGRAAMLIGSANLTGKGLSGRGHELLWLEDRSPARIKAKAAAKAYGSGLSPLAKADLAAFIDANATKVDQLKGQRRDASRDETRASPTLPRSDRFGSYEDFDAWVGQQRPGLAAETLYTHAYNRDGNHLSGHAKTCFYGGRQLLLAYPAFRRHLLGQKRDDYRVFNDPVAENRIKAFAALATDEPGFKAKSWRGTLPAELGGNVARRGGNIGSLNRTLPLLACYLEERLNT